MKRRLATALIGLPLLLFVLNGPARANDAPVTDQPAARGETKPLDVAQLFATTCGYCHSDAGRAAGKGPQLMNTTRSDEFIRNRIIFGKEGRMPSFGGSFSLEDIDRIIAYIRALKPD